MPLPTHSVLLGPSILPYVHTYRLVVPDCRHLSAEHDWGEESEEESLEDEEEEEHDGGRRREGATLVPLVAEAREEVVDGQEQGVDGHECDVQLKTG